MIIIIRNMTTGVGREHKFLFDINIKNNLQRMSVDKNFDLSYLISKPDISYLQKQQFKKLNILAAISFGTAEKFMLDIDKPIVDQLKESNMDALPDYSCEIHLLINNYAPMKAIGEKSTIQISHYLEDKKSSTDNIDDTIFYSPDTDDPVHTENEEYLDDTPWVPQKNKIRNITLASIIIVVMSVIAISGVSIITRNGNNQKLEKLQEYLLSNQYSDATIFYNDQIDNHTKLEEKATPIVENAVSALATKCFENGCNCEDALEELSYLEDIHNPEMVLFVKDTIETLSTYKDEKGTLETANQHLSKGEFLPSLKDCLKISDESVLHPQAQESYQKVLDAFFATISSPQTKEDYESYLNTLDNYINEIPSESKFIDKKNELENELNEIILNEEISAILASAKQEKDTGNLVAALDLIIDAIKNYGSENKSLNTVYDEYHGEYIANVEKEVSDTLDEKGYSSANKVIEAKLDRYPNDSELKEIKSYLSKFKPVSITSMNLINSDCWNWNDGEAEDPFQNSYSDACNYAVFETYSWSEDYSVEYRINEKYSILTGTISPQKNMSENGYGYIQIYADGVLTFTSPLVKQKTDAFDFTADIEGADYVTIKVMMNYQSAMLLSDIQLTPVSEGYSIKEKNYTSLTSLNVLNNNSWTWENDVAQDLSKTDYTHVCNYAVFTTYSWSETPYIEYRINKKYKKITGKIAPTSGMEENGYGHVEIYSEDTLLYSSENVTNKTNPFDFEVDVSGVDYLKIVVPINYRSGMILSDIKLW